MFPQNTWHMKMIEYNHFICHYYCHFPVYSHIFLSGKTWSSGRSLMTSSDSSSKLISCSFPRSVPDLVNHQYGICRMYSEENPQDFRLLIPGLYSCERVMLLLSAEASFKPGGPFFWKFASKHLPQRLILGRPSLAHKGCGYPKQFENLMLWWTVLYLFPEFVWCRSRNFRPGLWLHSFQPEYIL